MATFQRWPRALSSQVTNAIQRPSGLTVGAYSSGEKVGDVTRLAVPVAPSCAYTRPTAWKTIVFPSALVLGQRMNFAWTGSSVMRNSLRAISEIVRCTFAVKAIVDTAPAVTSTRRIFPPCATTIDLPSPAHRYRGSTPIAFPPDATIGSIGSMSIRSMPVLRSRSQSAVRGPYLCPLKEIVPSGISRAKASHRPSGDTSGAAAPPLEMRPAAAPLLSPAVISTISPFLNSNRRSCCDPESGSRSFTVMET